MASVSLSMSLFLSLSLSLSLSLCVCVCMCPYLGLQFNVQKGQRSNQGSGSQLLAWTEVLIVTIDLSIRLTTGPIYCPVHFVSTTHNRSMSVIFLSQCPSVVHCTYSSWTRDSHKFWCTKQVQQSSLSLSPCT